ncbi:MAG TPA: hemolysin III family protein [Candidatus Angelobacter sp.]|jgi:hemolysin III|nr:hemolysin III family protein [Candidatus Angelobacter sp.]
MQDSRQCELANALTHGIGVALALAGLAALVSIAIHLGSPRRVICYSVYGVSLVMLYTASTLYHAIHLPRLKRLLQTLDHMAIYLLIAGTYTPFALLSLRGFWGWSIFGLIWAIAALGVVFKLFFMGKLPKTSVVIYLAMGWLALIAIRQLFATLPIRGLVLVFTGGMLYTIGVLFFAFDYKHRYNHAIWHVFVLAGSTCHFFAVLVSTLP